jgi:pilus assembly protein CpaE
MSRNDVGELLSRLGEQPGRRTERAGRIISMISNKGGVGKSTLAVNAAAGLAMHHPDRVLLVDVSLQMGVCSSMLDLQPKTTLSDAYRQLDRLDEMLLRQLTTQHASGLHLLAAPDRAVEGIKIDDDTISRVLTLARRAYDFVIVDTFPMLDRVMMSVLDLSDMSYLIIENVVPTVLSGAKLMELLDSMGFDPAQQRVVLNRYARRPGSLRPMDVAQRLKRNIDHIFPFHNRVVQAANTGRPFALDVTRLSSLGRRTRNFIQGINQLAQHPVSPPTTIDNLQPTVTAGLRHEP